MKIKTLSLTLILTCSILAAECNSSSDNMPSLDETGDWTIIPFAFVTDAAGTAFGVGTIAQGLLQPQTTFVAALSYGLDQHITTNDNPETTNFIGGLLSYSNIKVPCTTQFFLSAWGFTSFYPRDAIYLDGSNDSDNDDVLTTAGESDFFTMTLDYVLPIGEGIDNPGNVYKMRDGFAMDREDYGNGTPFVTGRTVLGLKAFYQYQTIENWKESEPWSRAKSMPTWNDSGLRFFLLHDNTDYDLNPSRGYSFQIQYSNDFGWGDNLQSWDSLDLKYSKYFNLDTFSFTQQNVLALNFWTAYSPSWDTDHEVYPGIDAHRPPTWEGPRLGGFNRMRGYDNNRFSGKAAIYAAAEFRTILDWNPFKTSKFLLDYVPFTVDWFQVVPFVEAGRVNDEYNLDLVKDLKYDMGISIRAMVEELPLRLDIGASDEGVNMWVMIRHPFDF